MVGFRLFLVAVVSCLDGGLLFPAYVYGLSFGLVMFTVYLEDGLALCFHWFVVRLFVPSCMAAAEGMNGGGVRGGMLGGVRAGVVIPSIQVYLGEMRVVQELQDGFDNTFSSIGSSSRSRRARNSKVCC